MDHVIVVDLGFGDAGKGAVVDHLCRASAPLGGGPPGGRQVTAVVRFNGGAQAAHNVVTADGRHHTFAQFGSGTFTPGVRTHLSRFMLVDPLALAAEAGHLRAVGVRDALDRLTADRDAPLTTPYHRAANRARESARGAGRHGSCGMGIGETASYALAHEDAPRVGDCLSPARLRRRLAAVRDWYRDTFPDGEDAPDVDACADAFTAFAGRVRIVGAGHLHALLRTGRVVFEGAQGVLLDEWHGFHPYTTWSTTTFANAETLLAEAGASAARLGVLRTYATRHGPGPFVTEDPVLTADLPDPHNGTGRWQGAFRVGHLDAVALRYALDVTGGVDGLAVTHMDVAGARPDLRVCLSYAMDGAQVGRLEAGPPDLDRQAALTARLLRARPVYAPLGPPAETIEDLLQTPVVLHSHGPTSSGKRTAPANRTARRPRHHLHRGHDGMPSQLPGNSQAVPFQCEIPRSALTDPARPALYGHGLLGSEGEVDAGKVQAMASEHGFVFCATKWIGMSDEDVPNVVSALADLTRFRTVADRLQQSLVDFVFLGRAMTRGFATNKAFENAAGQSVIDTGAELTYDGNSQGGIMGGALTAVSPDIRRAVLGVPAMNYSTQRTAC